MLRLICSVTIVIIPHIRQQAQLTPTNCSTLCLKRTCQQWCLQLPTNLPRPQVSVSNLLALFHTAWAFAWGPEIFFRNLGLTLELQEMLTTKLLPSVRPSTVTNLVVSKLNDMRGKNAIRVSKVWSPGPSSWWGAQINLSIAKSRPQNLAQISPQVAYTHKCTHSNENITVCHCQKPWTHHFNSHFSRWVCVKLLPLHFPSLFLDCYSSRDRPKFQNHLVYMYKNNSKMHSSF